MSAQTRGKTSEREMAVKLQAAAGRIRDRALTKLVTATGRVGHLVEWGFDILVGNGAVALVGEAKRRQKFLSADALRALLQIDRIAYEWERRPVLAFRFSDDVPTYHTELVEGRKVRIRREWAVLPFDYANELMAARRFIAEHTDQGAFFEQWWREEQDTAELARRKAPAEEVETVA
jgi:hypothetical protein